MAPSLKVILSGNSGLDCKYVDSFAALERTVKNAKEAEFKVVLTQGVYDMFHVGHARYLAEAKSYGDMLIVGVDSDELTRAMKGEDRPFDVFDERIEILSHLSSVNIIARRHTDQHKYDLIKLVRPDVLVISETTATIAEEDKRAFDEYCGKLVNLERKAAMTTTAKLRRLKLSGAQGLGKHVSQAVEEAVKGYLEVM